MLDKLQEWLQNRVHLIHRQPHQHVPAITTLQSTLDSLPIHRTSHQGSTLPRPCSTPPIASSRPRLECLESSASCAESHEGPQRLGQQIRSAHADLCFFTTARTREMVKSKQVVATPIVALQKGVCQSVSGSHTLESRAYVCVPVGSVKSA